MALNYLKFRGWKQNIGHLKNMRYFPLTIRHHNDMLCRTGGSPRDMVFIENRESVGYPQTSDVPKPLQAAVPQTFDRNTLFVLPEIKDDKVKSHCNTDAVSDMLYSTVTKKKTSAGKMTKIKDRCLSEATWPSTQLSTSRFFVPAQRFKGRSLTAPFLESRTSFDDCMATQRMKADKCMKQEGENRISSKCEQNSEMEVLCRSSKTGDGESRIPKDLPSAKQLGIIQENLIEQYSTFFRRNHKYVDYDMKNMVFINNFFGKEKVYKGSHYPFILFGIRARCHMRFVSFNISVTSASHNVEDGTVKVYWQIMGVNQVYFVTRIWQTFRNPQSAIDNAEYYSGISLFHVNKEGKIYRHRVDRMDQVKQGKTVTQPELAMA